jgi:hypothetical protein
MKRSSRVLPAVASVLLLASCSGLPAAATVPARTADSGPRVSFASPESGTVLPPGPVPILILCEDPTGTALVEVLVDGVAVAVIPSPDSARDSVIVEYVWVPAVTGTYTLQAHAQNSAGTWGGFDSLELTIEEQTDAGDTPAFVPLATENADSTDVIAGPTATETPPVAETTPPATPTRSGIWLTWSFSELRMFEYGSSCTPTQNGVIVAVFGIDPQDIGSVMIFFRAKHKDTGVLGKWSPALGLELFESGMYGKGFTSLQFAQPLPFVPAVILHQFAVADKNGGILYRSDVYQELYLGPCVT